MKPLLFLLILILYTSNAHAIFPISSIRETQYRWRNNDGNEAAATWKGPENTPSIVSVGDTFRLRIELTNAGTAAGVANQTLQYSSNNGTTWTTMNNPATNAFIYQASTFVTGGTASTQQLANVTAGAFVPGSFISTPGTGVNLNVANKTEYEWCLTTTSNVLPSTTYLFRSAAIQVLPAIYPTLSINCSGSPVPGTIDATASSVPCHTATTVKLIGSTIGPGISFQWQYNNAGTWINFGTNSNIDQVTPLISENTMIQCIVKCSSGDSVIATPIMISPQPLTIDLGPDLNVCIDQGSFFVLEAGTYPHMPSFLWDDNSTAQTRNISQSGTYWVIIVDSNKCKGSDSINVTIRNNPVVRLGPDTSICNGAMLTLDAGSGNVSYFWNTGQTAQTIEVNSAGSYHVFVTNMEGCSSSDTINVITNGELPAVQGIQVNSDGNKTFYFNPINPQYVIGYDWDFGDGSPHSSQMSPSHTYDSIDHYVVVLRLASSCGFANDTAEAHIVGIHQLEINQDQLALFPNPSAGTLTLLNKTDLKIDRIEVYNALGRLMYHSILDSNNRYNLKLNNVAAGFYTVVVFTDKGTVVRKVEITK